MNAKQTTSDGGFRAATAAIRLLLVDPQDWNHYVRDNLAEIIDRETRLPELIEALTHISKVQSCGDHTRDIQALEACAAIARSALSNEQ